MESSLINLETVKVSPLRPLLEKAREHLEARMRIARASARKALREALVPYLTVDRDPVRLQAEDVRFARRNEILENMISALRSIGGIAFYTVPVIVLIDSLVISPLLQGKVPSTSVRLVSALFALFLVVSAIQEWKRLHSALLTIRHGPLSTDTGLEIHLKLAEASAFETGRGRIRSGNAACERFFKILQMAPSIELSAKFLTPSLVTALYGALRTCRAFEHPTRRYDAFATVVSQHQSRLGQHRVTADVLEHLLEDYIAASRSDYPCEASPLLLCARLAENILKSDPLFRDRIASIALRQSAMLPESFDIERINSLLAALTVLESTDGALPYVEQAILNEVVNLGDESQRGLLLSHLLNHPKISEGARTVLECALARRDERLTAGVQLEAAENTDELHGIMLAA